MQPPGFMAASAPAPPVFVEIADPVGGYRYSFDSNSHTAHRSPFGPVRVGKVLASPASPAYAVADRAPVTVVAPASSKGLFASASGVNAQRPHPETSNERLGTQTIEGVLAEGTRMNDHISGWIPGKRQTSDDRYRDVDIPRDRNGGFDQDIRSTQWRDHDETYEHLPSRAGPVTLSAARRIPSRGSVRSAGRAVVKKRS